MVPQAHSTRARLGALIAASALVATATFATAPPVLGAGSISLTSFGVPYVQDFNSLASTGTANTAVPTGWDFSESGANANTTYRAGTGSDTAGDTYSFGSTGNTERAFGGLRSGSLVPLIGAQFVNNTGTTIGSLAVAYTGEQWRLGQNTTGRAADRLDFQLSTSATSLTTGTWIDYDSLDFSSPVIAGTVGALNGNVSPNRTPISFTITGLAIANGATFWMRWADSDLIPGSDDGLSVDDFSLTPTVADGAPSVVSTVPANGATEVPLDSTVTVNFSEPVNVSGSWFSLSCATSGDHAATVSGGPTTFTLDPSADFVMGEACTLTVYAANVIDQDLIDPPDTMTVNFTTGFTTVLPIMWIGAVNGPVAESPSCVTHVSPYINQTVKVQGVVYEKTLQAISGTSDTYKGFYLENTAATADSDPTTSDGLFVFMSKATTIDGPSGPYTPTVGDEVVLTGKVSEYYNMTELIGPLAVQQIVRSGVDIDAEVAPVVADPPVALADANCYWERLQGMRVGVPQNSIVLGGRNVFSPADAEIWVAGPDTTVAERSDPYQRRAFRDAHPLDDNYDPAVWDGNGYRILMGSLGIKAAAGDAKALIDPARTFATLTNAPSGGLNYTFSKYRIEISAQPTFAEGLDPAQNNPPVVETSTQYTIVDYNLENLYDYRDNPSSGCDFVGNPGCFAAGTPFIGDVKPAFDYVPASEPAYEARLSDIATQIVNDLHSPDILMVQEVENQDFCSVVDAALACGTGMADGQPDVLQDLGLEVASKGGPAYAAAFDPNSSDLRGILPAFLYRTDRVELGSATGDPVLGQAPTIGTYDSVPYDSDVSNPKTLNAPYTGTGACETRWVFPRAPSVALFRVWATDVGSGNYADIYAINNHFKSGPDTCVAHRTEQAKYNAALVAYLEAAKPDARIVVAGDLNVYPRPDDPFAPIGEVGSSDQLGSLYNPALGLTNLWSDLLAKHPEAAYSYVYLGQAQTLDQMFTNSAMTTTLQAFRIAHINSDFPADYVGDVARGTSDHDPNVATFLLYPFGGFLSPVDSIPTLNVLKAGAAVPVKFSLGGDEGLAVLASGYPISRPIACDISEPTDPVEETVTAGSSGLRYDSTAGQYIYTWKTDKGWAGTCRALTLKLADGTTHDAYFKFTK